MNQCSDYPEGCPTCKDKIEKESYYEKEEVKRNRIVRPGLIGELLG